VVRTLLNDVPQLVVAVVFVGAIVSLTLAALFLASRHLSSWWEHGSPEVVLGVSAMGMTLFALVLAFVVVNLYSDYTSASADVTDEANALGALVQDARAFPPSAERAVDRAVARYVGEVRDHEFAALAKGHADPQAAARALDIVDALQSYSPRTETERTFYSAAADQLNLFLAERENRVAKAETEIPAPLLGLLIFLAIVTIAVSFLIRTNRRSVDIALVVVVAVIIASGMLTALILQYPYSGAIAVKSDPLTEGPLAHLPAQ
jgi:Protein of unknown function (DUF4239)